MALCMSQGQKLCAISFNVIDKSCWSVPKQEISPRVDEERTAPEGILKRTVLRR